MTRTIFSFLLATAALLPARALAAEPPLAEAVYPKVMGPAIKQFNAGAYEKALAALRRVKEGSLAEPDKLHYVRGLAERRAGDKEEAIAEFRKALAFRGSSSDTLAELGGCLIETGRKEEALQALQEAIWFGKASRVAPWQIYLQIGSIYEDQQKSAKAQETYRTAIALGGGAPAYLKLGSLLFDQGQKKPAAGALRQGLKSDPNDNLLREKLAVVLLANANRNIDQQDINEAVTLTQAILQGKSEAEQYGHPAYPVYLRALLAAGRLEEADQKLKAALAAQPANAAFQRLLQQMPFERQAAARETHAAAGAK